MSMVGGVCEPDPGRDGRHDEKGLTPPPTIPNPTNPPPQRDALLDTLRRLQEEEAEMGKELGGLQAQTAKEAAEVARLEAECAAAEAELEALNREQAAIRAEGGELKKRSQELKESVAGVGAAVENAKEECERVRGQIVRSPARVRRELATAAE